MTCKVVLPDNAITLAGSGQSIGALATNCPAGKFAWANGNPAVVTLTPRPAPDDNIADIDPVSAGVAVVTVSFSGASASVTVTVIARHFVIVFGDKGKGIHNLGRLPELAARTHEREIRAKKAPGVPAFGPADIITVTHVSTVADLIAALNVNNVIYLAYFGHSWNEAGSVGALFIGENHAADSNLTTGQDPPGELQTCTSPNTLPAGAFRPDASVRLFSCRGSFGTDSAAEQIAKHLKRQVFGFDNSGGSIFTNDPKLGHGLRSATAADLKAAVLAGKDVWMVPSDGTPHFKSFGP
ncbi:MAG TPA: hypothetical protein VI431_15760 [Candidatus Acidoferrum sp.]